MDKKKYDLITKKYGDFLEKISHLRKKKLDIIVKYRKKADEIKLQKLRNGDREANL